MRLLTALLIANNSNSSAGLLGLRIHVDVFAVVAVSEAVSGNITAPAGYLMEALVGAQHFSGLVAMPRTASTIPSS